jgi:hypothetical protein
MLVDVSYMAGWGIGEVNSGKLVSSSQVQLTWNLMPQR